MKKHLRNRRGQSLIEYLILVALVGVGSIGVMRVVGANVAIKFANVAKALGSGDGQAIEAEQLDATLYSKKDLSNFMQGASNTSARQKNK